MIKLILKLESQNIKIIGQLTAHLCAWQLGLTDWGAVISLHDPLSKKKVPEVMPITSPA